MYFESKKEWMDAAKERDYIIRESKDLPGFVYAEDEQRGIFGMYDENTNFGTLLDSLSEFYQFFEGVKRVDA